MAPPKAPARPKTVAEYIAAADPRAQPRLREMRRIVRSVAPGATEELKWSMPAHSYRRILVMYAAFKNHVSLFAGTPTIRAFKRELAKQDISDSTIRFPLNQRLPVALVRKVAAHRVKAAIEKDGKWRAKD